MLGYHLTTTTKERVMTVKASDLFIQALDNEGVDVIFAVPGEENLDLIESIRRSRIELVVTRHEQGAGFMAATHGRLTGRTGVCLATLGPGATNLVTPAAYAQLGAMPMLMITGQKPIKNGRQGRFQIVDVVDMMRPLTKLTERVVDGQSIPIVVREAFRVAEEERPGAVHIELPEDVAREQISDARLYPRGAPRNPAPDPKALRQAIAMIEEARHPLLLVGAGANRKRIGHALQRLIAETDIPFCNTQMGKGVIAGFTSHYLGTAALSEGDYVHNAIDHADLIINVGHDIIEKPPFLMRPDGAKVIHVNFSSANVDAVYFPQLELVGDIASSVEQLADGLERNPAHDFSYFEKVRDAVQRSIRDGSEDDCFPIIPQRLVRDVRRVMPEDGILALDNGMYKIWFARNYRTVQPNTVLLDNALAAMGAGLPSAMAAAMLHPDRRVMAVCGDGGFMMNSQEMETAVRLGLDVVVLIVRDDAYGMIRWKQSAEGFPDWGLEFGNPDFVAYSRSYGAQGHRIRAADELVPTLEHCFEAGGVHLVEVAVDYRENKRVLVDELVDCASRI